MPEKTPEKPAGKILALDFGEARIGVAASDEGRTLASPLCVIKRKNRDHDIKAIAELAAGEGAVLLVMGLPIKNENELGPGAERVLSWAKRLERVTGLEVALVDEFETTVEAQEVLLKADLSRKRRREVVDMVAAGLILRRYLDSLIVE